jgi:hypothetical protein
MSGSMVNVVHVGLMHNQQEKSGGRGKYNGHTQMIHGKLLQANDD